MMIKNKDNTLLVEFDFIIDLDLAMYRFVKKYFFNSPLLDKELFSIKDERKIKEILLSRKHINPLEIFIPNYNTTDLYYKLTTTNMYYDLLKESTAYDTFGLMITFLREASSVSIDILCKDKVESAVIKAMNDSLSTVIFPNKTEINLAPYTALYLKYFVNAALYKNLEGKHIYIPSAKFNMEDEEDIVDHKMLELYGHSNIIHLIDLYKDIKYKITRKGKTSDEDIL